MVLDRKTRGIDARIELLEDRFKQVRKDRQFFSVFTILFLLVPLGLFILYTELPYTEMELYQITVFGDVVTIGILVSLALSFIFLVLVVLRDNLMSYYSLLIYLKRNFEKDKEK